MPSAVSPIQSMTGYASLRHTTPEHPLVSIEIELRSVNNRFLDVQYKLCDVLRPYESQARELLQNRFQRGKIELRAKLITQTSGDLGAYSDAALEKLRGVEKRLQTFFPQAAPLSTADIMRLCSAQEPSENMDYAGAFHQALDCSAQALLESRGREGTRLKSILLENLDPLQNLCKSSALLIPQSIAAQQAKFLERFHDAAQSAGSTLPLATLQDRALLELSAFAIRIDVAEELSRLQAHISEMLTLLETGGTLGKRLDFLIQEMHREANTLGSKSSQLALTRHSVEMKVLIEQMREQVQNIQ